MTEFPPFLAKNPTVPLTQSTASVDEFSNAANNRKKDQLFPAKCRY